VYSRDTDATELPRKLKRYEKKPWVTHVTELKRRSRLEKRERQLIREVPLTPPENGLLVKNLIPVAHEVMDSRSRLLICLSKVSETIPIFLCSLCGDVHVGNPPHKIRTCSVHGEYKEHVWIRGCSDHLFLEMESFHLYDRLGRAVSHSERLLVDRIPAILELCIQAGVDIPQYPTRRYAYPVYRVAGKTFDFERRIPPKRSNRVVLQQDKITLPCSNTKDFAEAGMKEWENLRMGTEKLMRRYAVRTCGYCCEVQVGPKGHRARQCRGFKHQMRDGQHAWQEAVFDDLVRPVYVWHASKRDGNRVLVDRMKKYYGMLPGVVEFFGRGEAEIGGCYEGMMREDVVVPSLDEENLV
ncbi:hypothetical protein M569_07708, partial [Genlisea aurea]